MAENRREANPRIQRRTGLRSNSKEEWSNQTSPAQPETVETTVEPLENNVKSSMQRQKNRIIPNDVRDERSSKSRKNRTATNECRKQTKETVQITNGVKRMNPEGISASPPSKRRTTGEKMLLNSVENDLRVVQVNKAATHSQNKRQNMKKQELVAIALQSDEEVMRIRGSWQREIEDHIEREQKLQLRIERLEANSQNGVIANEDRKYHDDDWLVKKLYDQKNEIAELNSYIKRAQQRSKFANENLAHDQINSIIPSIDSDFKLLQAELESVTCENPEKVALHRPKCHQPSELYTLVHSVFGSCVYPVRNLTFALSKFDPELILRVLILAALREWVFMTDFPNFTSSDEGDDRLLNTYRQEVLIQGGINQLKNLDLASLDRMLRTLSYDEEIVPRKAKDLAARLSKVLSPFFLTTSDNHRYVDFETWGEESSTWQGRRDTFIRIFDIALRLKAKSVGTDLVFAFIVHPPGTSLVADTPSAVQTQNQPRNSQQSTAAHSKLWNHASILVYKPWDKFEEDPVASISARSMNFVSSDVVDKSADCLFSRDIVIPKVLDRRSADSQDATASPLESSRKTSKRSASERVIGGTPTRMGADGMPAARTARYLRKQPQQKTAPEDVPPFNSTRSTKRRRAQDEEPSTPENSYDGNAKRSRPHRQQEHSPAACSPSAEDALAGGSPRLCQADSTLYGRMNACGLNANQVEDMISEHKTSGRYRDSRGPDSNESVPRQRSTPGVLLDNSDAASDTVSTDGSTLPQNPPPNNLHHLVAATRHDHYLDQTERPSLSDNKMSEPNWNIDKSHIEDELESGNTLRQEEDCDEEQDSSTEGDSGSRTSLPRDSVGAEKSAGGHNNFSASTTDESEDDSETQHISSRSYETRRTNTEHISPKTPPDSNISYPREQRSELQVGIHSKKFDQLSSHWPESMSCETGGEASNLNLTPRTSPNSEGLNQNPLTCDDCFLCFDTLDQWKEHECRECSLDAKQRSQREARGLEPPEITISDADGEFEEVPYEEFNAGTSFAAENPILRTGDARNSPQYQRAYGDWQDVPQDSDGSGHESRKDIWQTSTDLDDHRRKLKNHTDATNCIADSVADKDNDDEGGNEDVEGDENNWGRYGFPNQGNTPTQHHGLPAKFDEPDEKTRHSHNNLITSITSYQIPTSYQPNRWPDMEHSGSFAHSDLSSGIPKYYSD